MGFDLKQFSKARFEDRTESVSVKDLADWFGEGEDPVIVVRGLTGEEVSRCSEATQKNQNISAMIEAVIAKGHAEKVDGMRQLLGVSASVPQDLAKRLEQFTMGTVDPDFDHETAVKFAETYPIEFYQITNKIMELTGQGRQLLKKKKSSVTQQ